MDTENKSGIEDLEQFAKGLFIGPRGGKWKDAQHKIPYKEEDKRKAKKKKTEAKKVTRHWVKGSDYGLPKKTIDVFKQGGEYTAKRKELHSKIMSKFLDHVPSVPKDKKPVALIMMGGGGAGKGTVVRHIMGDSKDFVNVNPDDCKEQLPEYQKGLNLGKKDGVPITAIDVASIVHAESSEIAGQIREKAIEANKNFILDGTGRDVDKYKGIVGKLKEKGYHVRVIMPHITLEEAKRRADYRADVEGRYVPHDVLDMAHHLIPGNFETIARAADEFALFDNGGRPPVPVWTFDGKEEKIHNDKFVSDFKTMAVERHKIAREKEWLKSLVGSFVSLQKSEDGMKPAVTMDEMLDRMKKDRGEAPDNSTMLDDFEPEVERETEKELNKSMDAIDELKDFAKGDKALDPAEQEAIDEEKKEPKEMPLGKGGPFIGPRGGKYADAEHTIPWSEFEAQWKKRKEEQKARDKKKKEAKKSLDPISDLESFAKGGPYIGPRGGKWKDAQHKIPWDDKPAKGKAKKKEAGTKDNPLKKLPGNTDIRDYGGLAFSKWEGKLALVYGPTEFAGRDSTSSWFDPETMTHKYHIKNAIDSRTKQSIPANDAHLGLEPRIPYYQRNQRYENTSFTVGGDTYHTPPESGGFDKGKDVWVQSKLKDLTHTERRRVEKNIRDKGFKDGTPEWGHYDTLKASEWKKAFKMSFSEIQKKAEPVGASEDAVKLANGVDRFLDAMGVDVTDHKDADRVWASIPGVFLTNKGGVLKTIIERPGKKKVKKSMEDTEMTPIDELKEFSKAQSMPTGKPSMGTGTEQGGPLAGKGKTSGTNSSSSGEPINAPKSKKQKLSEDDADEEKQMKPGKKPIETIKKSDTTPQGQRASVAQEHAAKVSQLKKGEEDVEVGVGVAPAKEEPEAVEKSSEWNQGDDSRVTYSDRADKEASALVKSEEFYTNGSPTLGRNPMLTQHTNCPECKETVNKSLSACPTCGYGSIKHKVTQGVAIGEVALEKSERKAPLLQPRVEKDLALPNGYKPTDE